VANAINPEESLHLSIYLKADTFLNGQKELRRHSSAHELCHPDSTLCQIFPMRRVTGSHVPIPGRIGSAISQSASFRRSRNHAKRTTRIVQFHHILMMETKFDAIMSLLTEAS
jgi:hypothetical protein